MSLLTVQLIPTAVMFELVMLLVSLVVASFYLLLVHVFVFLWPQVNQCILAETE